MTSRTSVCRKAGWRDNDHYVIKNIRDIALMARKKEKGIFGYFCGRAKVTPAERLKKIEKNFCKILYVLFYFTTIEICAYLTNRNTKKAVSKKSINVDITFPYKTPLYERSSICFTLSLLRMGLRIIGVTRSSIIHFTSAHTLVAISNHTATPITLYWERNAINSLNMIDAWKYKKSDIVYITRKKNQQVFFDRFLAQELLKYYRICLH